MPSITAYTPYETLAFCQTVARYGARASAFEDIANVLNANQLIRESADYDQSRLTATALQALYGDLLQTERNQHQTSANGEDGATTQNPRKRKLSTSPTPNAVESPELLHALVDKLYARFREQVIKEIRRDEEEYGRLEAEIADLQEKVDQGGQQTSPTHTSASSPPPPPPPAAPGDQGIPASGEPARQPPASSSTIQDAASVQLPAGLDASRRELPIAAAVASPTPQEARTSPNSLRGGQFSSVAPSQRSPAPSTPSMSSARPSTEPPQARSAEAAGLSQHQSPGAFHRTLPPPSPQRPNYGPIPNQHAFPHVPQGHSMPILPPPPGMPPHMPPPLPMDFPNPKRTASASSGPGRGSPLPLPHQQSPYAGYPAYPQPPWPPHLAPQHQYPPHSPYASPPFYVPSPSGRHGAPYQTRHHSPYQPYPQTAPVHYPGRPSPAGWSPLPHPGPPYYGYPVPGTVTPVHRAPAPRPVVRVSGSSTPWKRRTQLLPRSSSSPPQSSGTLRPRSPTRPEREVSPLTDRESPAPERATRRSARDSLPPQRKKDDDAGSKRRSRAVRGRQTTSATPSSAFAGSRSQSIASRNSETPTEKASTVQRGQKIKAEPPSTPAPVGPDTDQAHRSSGGRRGRRRNDTLTPRPDLPPTTTTTATTTTGATKRKRSSVRDSSATPSPPSPALVSPRRRPPQVPNDASLVAVSKNFVKTSQLLLNEITSHKLAGIFAKPLSERDAPGYKNLVLRPQDLKSIKAAINKGGKAGQAAIEALDGDRESGHETVSRAGAGEGPVGNGIYWVKKTEDLVPPKGIVNSSQLELELVRMFANAVMFNPLPSSERGFGRSLRLRKNGGDVVVAGSDMDGAVSEEDSGSSSGSIEEGGIIADTREMFKDVLEQVTKWRELEDERLGGDEGAKATHTSLSASVDVSNRQSSVSSAVNNEEEGGGGGVAPPAPATPATLEAVNTSAAASGPPTVTGIGTSRKRRKMAEN